MKDLKGIWNIRYGAICNQLKGVDEKVNVTN